MRHIRFHSIFFACILAATGLAPAIADPPAVDPPAAMPSAEGTYTIHPGDQLSIQVYGDATLTQNVRVLEDGTIDYPLIGHLRLAGESPAQAAQSLQAALLKFLRHPDVTVAVAQQGQSNVLVLGAVKLPGKYVVRSGARVTDAIASAGGLGPTNGNLPDARITQPNGESRNISLQALLAGGDASQNVPVSDNAIVYIIGPLPIQIQVLGAVDRPGNVEISQGERLSSAIARAGTSANSKADLNHVVITHREASGKTAPLEVNMYEALKGGNLKADPVLQKDDVVYVPISRQPSPFAPMNLISRLIGL